MVRPCPHRVDCEGSDFPITNYSAEGPETNPLNPCLWFPGTWKEVGGLNLCVSEGGNPDDCFICAKTPKDPDPDKLCNEEQTCTVDCPGGTSVTFTVPAGTFCDTDSELPPPSPTAPPAAPIPPPPPLPPPPPALGVTVLSSIPNTLGQTVVTLRAVGMNPLNDYLVRFTFNGNLISNTLVGVGSSYDLVVLLADLGTPTNPSIIIAPPEPEIAEWHWADSSKWPDLIINCINLSRGETYQIYASVGFCGASKTSIPIIEFVAPSETYVISSGYVNGLCGKGDLSSVDTIVRKP